MPNLTEELLQNTIQEVKVQLATVALAGRPRMALNHSQDSSGHLSHISSSGAQDTSRTDSQQEEHAASAGLASVLVPPSGMGSASMEYTSELMKLVADSLGHLRDNTQESADVALRNAAAVASLGDLLGQLFRAIEECVKMAKDAKLQKEEMGALVTELSQQLQSERESGHATAGKNSELQEYIKELQVMLEERQSLLGEAQAQLMELQQTHEEKSKNAELLRSRHLQVESQLDDLSEELHNERAQKEALKIAKQQLQSQLKHMVKAEKDLTKGLRDAHEQIEEQLQQLRNEVAHEKSAKEAVKAKKAAMAASIKELTAKSKADQQLIEQLQADVLAAKQANAKLSSELKMERKVSKAATANDKVHQEKCEELQAQLHALRTNVELGKPGSRKGLAAAKKKVVSTAPSRPLSSSSAAKTTTKARGGEVASVTPVDHVAPEVPAHLHELG